MPDALPQRTASAAQIQRNLAAVRERIASAAARADRDAAGITMVAVTKTVGIEEIRALQALGVQDFGENRIEHAAAKIAEIGSQPCWHMIGHVQRRKAREVAAAFNTVDSLDRVSIAEALQKRCGEAGTHMNVSLEVNVSGEEAKYGFTPAALSEALDAVAGMDRLRVRGLMTMAPLGADESALRRVFAGLRELAGKHELYGLSMGMTGDFEIAIEEGATEIRIGRALFV